MGSRPVDDRAELKVGVEVDGSIRHHIPRGGLLCRCLAQPADSNVRRAMLAAVIVQEIRRVDVVDHLIWVVVACDVVEPQTHFPFLLPEDESPLGVKVQGKVVRQPQTDRPAPRQRAAVTFWLPGKKGMYS